MNYLRTLILLAAVAAALMGLAGIASATTFTSPTGTAGTVTIKAESEGGHVSLANPIANISCLSSFQGTVEGHGPGATAKSNIGGISFAPCTNSWHMTIVAVGSLEFHWTSGHDGTVTSTGLTIDATRLGVTCVYATNNTQIGTFTGGNPATFHISASIPVHSGSSALCGAGNTTWEGNYVTKSAIYLDQ
ncbi:MAG TPA: hypothetical protein VFR75_04140 [Solirubrobacterales bacterium]|nr:hypothetical protein [Solirubrobacterales bacterium]